MQEKNMSDIGLRRQGFWLQVVPCGPEGGCTITPEEAGENQREQWQLQGLCSCIAREQLNNNIQMMKGKRYYYTVYIFKCIFNLIKVGKKNGRYCEKINDRIMGRPSLSSVRFGLPNTFVPGIIPFPQKM